MRSLANLQEETISKNIDATSDFDQFRHPADAGNHRIIPLLEVYLWPVRQMRGVFTHASDQGRQLVRQTLGTISGTDQRTERRRRLRAERGPNPCAGIDSRMPTLFALLVQRLEYGG